MLKIQSGINQTMIWNIKTDLVLGKADIKFIKKLALDIFYNDLTGEYWAFDTKLPSGKWLENITFTNEMKEINTIIY